LRRQHLAEHAPNHLSGGHAPAACRGFQLQGLPEWKQEWKLNDFLVSPDSIGRNHVEKRLHGITCHGGREVTSFVTDLRAEES
jgi:hypothetical protein